MHNFKENKFLNTVDEIPFSGKISSHCSQMYFYYTVLLPGTYLTEVVNCNDRKPEHFFREYGALNDALNIMKNDISH
jgi:hypothetical protein